jgi:dTDP-4-dehydrorhamnose reductase
MIRLGMEKETLGVVYDQIGSPTWTGDLAQAILSISTKITPETTGIYHYTNSGVCSWYDLAHVTFMETRRLGINLRIKTLSPITTIEYPTPAARPNYSVLSCKKITELLGKSSPHWQDSLRSMLRDYLKNSPD